jgi:hypothetical protein
MKKESSASEALNGFIQSVGVPKELISDGAWAETQGKFGKVIKEYRIRQRITEPRSPWQNRAESTIRDIKRSIRWATTQARSSKRLWDHCGEWVSAVRRLTAHDIQPTRIVEF